MQATAGNRAAGAILLTDRARRLTEVLHDLPTLGTPGAGQLLDRWLGGSPEVAALFDAAREAPVVNWMLARDGADQPGVLFATVAPWDGGFVCLLVESPGDLEPLYRALSALRPDLAAGFADHLPEAGADPLRQAIEEVGRLNTELIDSQRQLARANADLTRVNAEMQRMLGVAAHDLRSPLGVISAYSEVLEQVLADRLRPRELEMLDSIRTATAYMRRLLDDTLDYAKIEAGTLSLDRQPCDLTELVRTSVQLQQVVAEQAGRRLLFSAAERLPELEIDPDKIRQVIDNLLSNAIRHGAKGGRIEVAVRAEGGGAVVAVRDDGAGISEADQARLFRPFVQLGRGGAGGAGLGLAICRRIAEAHGGRISLASRPGAGSTFRLHLPTPAAAAASNQPSA